MIIDIKQYMNHKITKRNNFCESREKGQYGIANMVIEDEQFDFEEKIFTIANIEYLIYGNKSNVDNFISSGQKIKIEQLGIIEKIEIIGFNEFGNYVDNIELIDENHNHTKKKIQFYPIIENVESMYEWEMSVDCSVFLRTTIGGFMQANIYRYEIESQQELSEIVFPESEELHILAISIVLRNDRDDEKER